MPKSNIVFKRILVVSHPQLPEAIEVMGQIVSYLKDYGVPTAQGLIYDVGPQAQDRQW